MSSEMEIAGALLGSLGVGVLTWYVIGRRKTPPPISILKEMETAREEGKKEQAARDELKILQEVVDVLIRDLDPDKKNRRVTTV